MKSLTTTLTLLVASLSFTLGADTACAYFAGETRETLDLSCVQNVQPVNDGVFSKIFVNKYLPAPQSLTPTTNAQAFGDQFSGQVQQKVGQSILDSDVFKKSAVGQLSKQVQTMATVSPLSMSSSPGAGGIQQKVNMDLRAADRKAVLSYSGYFNSSITYQVDNATLVTSISKPLGSATSISLQSNGSLGQLFPGANLNFVYTF